MATPKSISKGDILKAIKYIDENGLGKKLSENWQTIR